MRDARYVRHAVSLKNSDSPLCGRDPRDRRFVHVANAAWHLSCTVNVNERMSVFALIRVFSK